MKSVERQAFEHFRFVALMIAMPTVILVPLAHIFPQPNPDWVYPLLYSPLIVSIIAATLAISWYLRIPRGHP